MTADYLHALHRARSKWISYARNAIEPKRRRWATREARHVNHMLVRALRGQRIVGSL